MNSLFKHNGCIKFLVLSMKLSDYVAEFLAQKGAKHVFAVAGGASLHLIDSVAKNPDLNYVCPHHEQAGSMAADAYSRLTGNIGVAIATSGPGATNMITGICCAYYDSVPVLYITGQVSTFRDKGDTGVRQIGFQETEIIPMVASITNYAVKINDSTRIRYELEKALYLATNGRPGPVLIDLPDNLQREEIEPRAGDTANRETGPLGAESEGPMGRAMRRQKLLEEGEEIGEIVLLEE